MRNERHKSTIKHRDKGFEISAIAFPATTSLSNIANDEMSQVGVNRRTVTSSTDGYFESKTLHCDFATMQEATVKRLRVIPYFSWIGTVSRSIKEANYKRIVMFFLPAVNARILSPLSRVISIHNWRPIPCPQRPSFTMYE